MTTLFMQAIEFGAGMVIGAAIGMVIILLTKKIIELKKRGDKNEERK